MWFTFCILASVQCTELVLYDMILMSEENTRALVTAMRDRVQTVVLYAVTLDIEELTQYDGQGRCRELEVRGHTLRQYGDRLWEWAADKTKQDKGWRVIRGAYGLRIWMERSPSQSPGSVSQSNCTVM